MKPGIKGDQKASATNAQYFFICLKRRSISILYYCHNTNTRGQCVVHQIRLLNPKIAQVIRNSFMKANNTSTFNAASLILLAKKHVSMGSLNSLSLEWGTRTDAQECIPTSKIGASMSKNSIKTYKVVTHLQLANLITNQKTGCIWVE